MTDSITCPKCGMTSHNPNDIAQGYCGNCHEWTTDLPVSETKGMYERTPKGGFIIARTDEFIIEVSPMIYNWRVHLALPERYGFTWEKGYCYFGTGLDTLLEATVAAEEWAKGDPFTTDPPDFGKRAF